MSTITVYPLACLFLPFCLQEKNCNLHIFFATKYIPLHALVSVWPCVTVALAMLTLAPIWTPIYPCSPYYTLYYELHNEKNTTTTSQYDTTHYCFSYILITLSISSALKYYVRKCLWLIDKILILGFRY